jgi:1-deoxy-D-xylulose-5-phosphate reductoisomerase
VGTGALTFEPWDDERFPCFGMALEVAQRGGTWPAALAGADDAAVQRFLEGRIGFLEIGTVILQALEDHLNVEEPSVDEILEAAEGARERVNAAVGV